MTHTAPLLKAAFTQPELQSEITENAQLHVRSPFSVYPRHQDRGRKIVGKKREKQTERERLLFSQGRFRLPITGKQRHLSGVEPLYRNGNETNSDLP